LALVFAIGAVLVGAAPCPELFQGPTTTGVGDGPQWLAVADFNSDGHLDVAVSNNVSGDITILLGTGGGAFVPSGSYPAGSSASGITAVDLNADGSPDLVNANGVSDDVTVLLGIGDGTFQPAVSYTVGDNPWEATHGDLNKDGKEDIVVNNYSTHTISVLLGNGDGTLQPPTDIPVDQYPTSVAVGDLDGDGNLDLVVGRYNMGNPATIGVLMGTGTGAFGTPVYQPGGHDVESVTLEDLNLDGHLDIVTAERTGNGASVLIGNGDGSFQAAVHYATGGYASSVAVGDFDGDGLRDLAVTNVTGNSLSVLIGLGTGAFQPPVDLALTNPAKAALGDFDEDGRPDLLVTHHADDLVSLLLGNCGILLDTARLVAAFSTATAYPGDPIAAALGIQEATDLYAAQATCTVSPTVLEPVGGAFGDFFDPVHRLIGANQVDSVVGSWLGAISQRSPAGPLTGSGPLATVSYTALAPGTTDISCDPLFSDRDGQEESSLFLSLGELTVLPFASIGGVATHQGQTTHEGITVTATGAVTVSGPTNGSGDFLIGELRAGDYSLQADAPRYLPSCTTVSGLLPGEARTVPATTLRGGDSNDDDVVNIGDATLVAANFSTTPPGDERADINADGTVDVRDLAILGGNYELSACQPW
jgi:hypothetical protein